MHPAALEKARQIAKAVTDNLGIGLDGQSTGLGLFGVELFVKGDQVWFSEVSPRPHDTGMVTLTTQWQNEFELHARAILGLPVDTSLRKPRRQRRDLRRRGCDRHRVRRRGRGPARARHRHAPVRQARELCEAPHGRGAGACADVETARGHAKLAASKVRPEVKNQVKWAQTQRRWVIVRYE
jgi:phosphoribosylglycinamide formyltransferase 2